MLSLVYGIYDRTDLFATTLKSLARQTLPPAGWELVVVNDGQMEDAELVDVLRTFATQYDWNVAYYLIDVTRLPWPVFFIPGTRANNPSPAWNVGIRAAHGDRIILSSPEIEYMGEENLSVLDEWSFSRGTAVIADVYDETFVADPRFRGWIGGGPSNRPLNFLAMYHRGDLVEIGGFAEQFVQGWAWDDIDFVERWGRHGWEFEFTGAAVQGWHQRHTRPEGSVQDASDFNRRLCETWLQDPAYRVANIGHAWGDRMLIVREWVVQCSQPEVGVA